MTAGADLNRAEIGRCLIEGKTNLLVIGDSHAPEVAVAMLLRTKANVVLLSRPGCPPYFGQKRETLDALSKPCRNADAGSWSKLLDEIETLPNVDGLLVVGNWTAKEFKLDDLKDSIDRLQFSKIKVGVVGVTPVFATSIPRLHETGKIGPGFGDLRSFMGSNIDPFGRDRVLRKAGITYIDVLDTLCGQACDAYNGGKVMYFDTSHLALDGVKYLLSHGVYESFVNEIEQRPTRSQKNFSKQD
jgi:hypothetical protein